MRPLIIRRPLATLGAAALAACSSLAGPADLLLKDTPPTLVAVVTTERHVTVPAVCGPGAAPSCAPWLSFYELDVRVPFPAESVQVAVGDSTPVFVRSGLRVVRTTAAAIAPADSIEVWAGQATEECGTTPCRRSYPATRVVIDQ